MLSVATTSQLRELESKWILQCNAHWGQVLMELAGNAAAKVAHKMLADKPGYVLIICATGNNGGDGLVVARYLHLWNVPTRVEIVNSKKSSGKTKVEMVSEEANANLAIAQHLGVPVNFIDDADQVSFENVALVVDSLFGTGMDRPIEGLYKELINRINKSGCSVLAIDVPSGINSDNGQIMGAAIQATETVTFGYLKSGLLCYPGAELCGKLTLANIGLPQLGDRSPKVSVTTCKYVQGLLPTRRANSNKGSYGTLLTIAGSLGMSGSTLLSAESSLRVGCGLSLLATPKSLVPNLPAQEVIYIAVAETNETSIHPKAIAQLKDELQRATALVIGPGMSTHPETVEFVRQLIANILDMIPTTPCIIDADALNAIAKHPDCLLGKRHPFVLTPHPKELSRLTGTPTAEIQADRISAVTKAAKLFSSVVLLKGANTVIADPDGNVFINPTGNSSMAKAGAGDVLSGIIGGLLAQGLTPLHAAMVGAYIHGRAGELASQLQGLSGVIAGDISIYIPEAVNTINDGILSKFEEDIA